MMETLIEEAETAETVPVGTTLILEYADFQNLLDSLRAHGYAIIGPTVRDGAIVYDDVEQVTDLPVGWTDEQEAGHYRLHRRDDEALFGYAVGPTSWKRFLHPPLLRLYQAHRTATGFTTTPEPTDPAPKRALLGVRACELQAIAVQDRVLLDGPYVDPAYAARRANLFIVAVNCGKAGGTCFCVSMDSGPQARSGYDLALTEILEGPRHYFVVEVGTPEGAAIMTDVPHMAAGAVEQIAAGAVVAATAASMGRQVNTAGLKEILYQSYDNSRWDEVASRCLSCANCTMVCPTCFCTTVEDVNDLAGQEAGRVRRWDSCFTTDFSYIHGGSVRATPKARYRQWLTHKLATWIDQFGTAGCVGCGRCITWCPVGIDITQEAAVLRGSSPGPVLVTGGSPDANA
jgi:ferredoxin